jgi:UDP-glucose 4-epimerase
MTWLITGGAGYIGAHVVNETIRSGRSAVVLDDLSTGIKQRLPVSVPLEVITLTDRDAINDLFDRHSFSGVLHLAAKKQVGESVDRPDYYWEQNVHGLQNLVDAMVVHEVKNFVFSSSASVYGQPILGDSVSITEDIDCAPINPYGLTKLEGEHIAEKLVANCGFKVAALRYFNVAGAGQPELGDQFALNLIPIVFEALGKGLQPQVFGDDYPTLDGSCIRDYVHVQDLAEAHVAAMDYVEKAEPIFSPINIGTGSGASVFEVLAMIEKVSGIEIEPILQARRAGDPAELIADVSRAKKMLNWSSKRDLFETVQSAWSAWQLKRD